MALGGQRAERSRRSVGCCLASSGSQRPAAEISVRSSDARAHPGGAGVRSSIPAACRNSVRTGPDTASRRWTPVPGQFGTQPLAVGRDERLRTGVSRLTRKRVEARGGTHVGNHAATAWQHLLHRAGRQVDDRFDVNPHLRDLVSDQRLGRRADRSDAGVVHQDLDGQAAVADRVEQARPRVGVRDVTGQDLDPHGVTQFGRQVAQLVLAGGRSGRRFRQRRARTSKARRQPRLCRFIRDSPSTAYGFAHSPRLRASTCYQGCAHTVNDHVRAGQTSQRSP